MSKVFVELFQVKDDMTRDFGFMGLKERDVLWGENGGTKQKAIDMSVYDHKYIANVCDGWVAGHYVLARAFAESDMKGLEEMFQKFNVEPELYREHASWPFTGRSMSVSDIVKVERPREGTQFYYCDSVGFVPVEVKNAPLPFEVGTGVTAHGYSDSYPYFISRISQSGKTFWVKAASTQADIEGGHDYFTNQKYIVTPNDNNPEEMVKRHADGSWYLRGMHVSIGSARYYQDPHF